MGWCFVPRKTHPESEDWKSWKVKPTLTKWFGKLSLSAMDQGVYSGANFLTSVLLARWLAPSDYGLFVLLTGAFLFIAGLHNSFLLEPMTVLGPQRNRGALWGYLSSSRRAHYFLVLFLTLLTLLGGIVYIALSNSATKIVLLTCLTVAFPAMLHVWFVRRVAYLFGNPAAALRCSLITSALQLCGIVLLHQTRVLSMVWLWLVIAGSNATGGAVVLSQIGRTRKSPNLGPRPTVKELMKENWGYARWATATTIVSWLSSNFYYFLVAGYLDMVQTAALRATQNLIQPIGQVMTAMNLLILPFASQRFYNSGLASLRLNMVKATVVMAGGAALYCGGIFWFGAWAMSALYAGRYDTYSWLLPYLIMVPIFGAATFGLQIGLRVVSKPQAIFLNYLVTSSLALSIGVVIVKYYGLEGAAVGMLFSSAVQVPVLLWLWNRYRWVPARTATVFQTPSPIE